MVFYHADSLVDVVVRLGSLTDNIDICSCIGLQLPSSPVKWNGTEVYSFGALIDWLIDWERERERERERDRETQRERERAMTRIHDGDQGKSAPLHMYWCSVK